MTLKDTPNAILTYFLEGSQILQTRKYQPEVPGCSSRVIFTARRIYKECYHMYSSNGLFFRYRSMLFFSSLFEIVLFF